MNNQVLGSPTQNIILETAGKIYIKVGERYYELNYKGSGGSDTSSSFSSKASSNDNKNNELIIKDEDTEQREYLTKDDVEFMLSNYVPIRGWEDVIDTREMLENSGLEGFTESITPMTVQTMQTIVGSDQLQFNTVINFTDDTVTDHIIHPSSTETESKISSINGAGWSGLDFTACYIKHYTADGPKDVQSIGLSLTEDPEGYTEEELQKHKHDQLKQYCRWHVTNPNVDDIQEGYRRIDPTITTLELPDPQASYYIYIRAPKINATEADINAEDDEQLKHGIYAKTAEASFISSTEAISYWNEDEQCYYFLYGIANAVTDGTSRSFVKMNGFTEITPGQVTAYVFRTPEGTQFLDFLKKKFKIGNYDPSTKTGEGMDWNVSEPNTLTIRGKLSVTGGDVKDALDDIVERIQGVKKSWYSDDIRNSNPEYHTHDEPTLDNWPAKDWKLGVDAYIIEGSTPFSSGWLSATEGGEPFSPPSPNNFYKIVTEGEYKDLYYFWDSSITSYVESSTAKDNIFQNHKDDLYYIVGNNAKDPSSETDPVKYKGNAYRFAESVEGDYSWKISWDYAYLTNALLKGRTDIANGLILSSEIVLGSSNMKPDSQYYYDNYIVRCGMNGQELNTKLGTDIAAWYGGEALDKEDSTISADDYPANITISGLSGKYKASDDEGTVYHTTQTFQCSKYPLDRFGTLKDQTYYKIENKWYNSEQKEIEDPSLPIESKAYFLVLKPTIPSFNTGDVFKRDPEGDRDYLGSRIYCWKLRDCSPSHPSSYTLLHKDNIVYTNDTENPTTGFYYSDDTTLTDFPLDSEIIKICDGFEDIETNFIIISGKASTTIWRTFISCPLYNLYKIKRGGGIECFYAYIDLDTWIQGIDPKKHSELNIIYTKDSTPDKNSIWYSGKDGPSTITKFTLRTISEEPYTFLRIFLQIAEDQIPYKKWERVNKTGKTYDEVYIVKTDGEINRDLVEKEVYYINSSGNLEKISGAIVDNFTDRLASSVIRMDGSGYFADGFITWNSEGMKIIKGQIGGLNAAQETLTFKTGAGEEIFKLSESGVILKSAEMTGSLRNTIKGTGEEAFISLEDSKGSPIIRLNSMSLDTTQIPSYMYLNNGRRIWEDGIGGMYVNYDWGIGTRYILQPSFAKYDGTLTIPAFNITTAGGGDNYSGCYADINFYIVIDGHCRYANSFHLDDGQSWAYPGGTYPVNAGNYITVYITAKGALWRNFIWGYASQWIDVDRDVTATIKSDSKSQYGTFIGSNGIISKMGENNEFTYLTPAATISEGEITDDSRYQGGLFKVSLPSGNSTDPQCSVGLSIKGYKDLTGGTSAGFISLNLGDGWKKLTVDNNNYLVLQNMN